MPYCQVLCYLHSVMLINGNNTKWRNEDKAQTEKDTAFINSLDL